MKYVLFLQDLGLTREQTRELLTEAGCTYEPLWADDDLDAKSVRDDVAILVTSEHHVGHDELDPWPNLEMLSLAFTGYNDVKLDLCRERELYVYYVPGYSTDSVAELTVGLTLAVLRRIPYANSRVRSGHWDRGDVIPGVELANKTVGILGTGTIGRRSARIFKAFGCDLIGWSRTARTGFPGEYRENVDDVFREADIVALHLPVDDETRGVVNRGRIELMRPTSILVNTARAELVDTQALAEAIRDGRIAGAGIDVYDPEPADAKGDPLFELNDRNVVLTPHLGFKTEKSLQRLAKLTIENIGRFLLPDPDPINRLLPEGTSLDEEDEPMAETRLWMTITNVRLNIREKDKAVTEDNKAEAEVLVQVQGDAGEAADGGPSWLPCKKVETDSIKVDKLYDKIIEALKNSRRVRGRLDCGNDGLHIAETDVQYQ